ncbi:transposase is4 [Holotrichia oblita]|uniref:Transposase is4 n=1 Tax=Holotrichia oblita TaxID=644536 RepID=A0ACB9TJE7_HOLOL|nr:transposase is4 [Holotrichia oblita]
MKAKIKAAHALLTYISLQFHETKEKYRRNFPKSVFTVTPSSPLSEIDVLGVWGRDATIREVRQTWRRLNGSESYRTVIRERIQRETKSMRFFFGKCTAPFISMLESLPHPEYPYKVYLDNLFVSMNLLNFLCVKGYGGSGTIKENSIPKTCPLPTMKTMQKRDHGSYESAIGKMVKWADSNVITAGSNYYGLHSLGRE